MENKNLIDRDFYMNKILDIDSVIDIYKGSYFKKVIILNSLYSLLNL